MQNNPELVPMHFHSILNADPFYRWWNALPISTVLGIEDAGGPRDSAPAGVRMASMQESHFLP
jgi:hypothetical protein